MISGHGCLILDPASNDDGHQQHGHPDDQHDHHGDLLGDRLHSNQLLLNHAQAHHVSISGCNFNFTFDFFTFQGLGKACGGKSLRRGVSNELFSILDIFVHKIFRLDINYKSEIKVTEDERKEIVDVHNM